MLNKAVLLQDQPETTCARETPVPLPGAGRIRGARIFDDPDAFSQHLRQVSAEITVVGGGPYLAALQIVPLERMVLQRGWQSPAHVGRIKTPEDRCLFLFLLGEDQAPARVARAEVAFADLIYSTGGSEYYCRGGPGTAWTALSPRADALMTAAALVCDDAPDVLNGTFVLRPSIPAGKHLRSLTQSVGDLAARAPETLQHRPLARAVEESLLRATALCLYPTDVRRSPIGRFGKGAAIIRRFEAFLEANADTPLYLTEVCAGTGVKARALRYWCHEYFGMGPIRYLCLRRMHLARRALLTADPAVSSVTSIANDFGFAELGRFAGNYRRIFGETPSATLRRRG